MSWNDPGTAAGGYPERPADPARERAAEPTGGNGPGQDTGPGQGPGRGGDVADAVESGEADGRPDEGEPATVAVGARAARRASSSMRRVGRRIRAGERPLDIDRPLRLLGYRHATTALVLLALVALYGVAGLSRPSGITPARGDRAPVTSEVLGCPDPGGSRLSVLTPGPAGRSGRVDITETQAGTARGTVTASGTAWSTNVRNKPGGRRNGTTGSYTVRAIGALAGGLEVEQTSVRTKGTDRWLAGVRCTEPDTDLWFLGPGPAAARDIELFLTNVDDQPAVVDTLALSGEGPLDTPDGRGTVVASHSSLVITIGDTAEGLGDIVQTARVLALRVRASMGRVAAAVRVRAGDGNGADWVPLTASPAQRVVVPGVPPGGGRRRLLVAVPGEADARLKVKVITSAGTFAPEGQDTLDAPAQTVTPLDLERALSGKAAAITLDSDRPIIAGFMVDTGGDVAYGAATRALGGDAGAGAGGVVADNRPGSVVLLTAPEGAATVRVTAVTGNGAAADPQEVQIAAGRTVQVPLRAPAGAGSGFGVLLTPAPGSGPVYAARVLSTGKGSDRLLSILPVVPALISITRPPVGDSLTALLP